MKIATHKIETVRDFYSLTSDMNLEKLTNFVTHSSFVLP